MSQAVIDNPVINSQFAEPQRHFPFSDERITGEIVALRRTSPYFIPIAAPKKKGRQQFFDTDWTQDRVPAVNNHGESGRWAFLDIRDAWDAKNEIRTALPQKKP